MQGKLIFAIACATLGSTAALAGDSVRRQTCPKAEQAQQRPQQAQQPQQRAKPQGCPLSRPIPPVVDPTPMFLL